MGSSNANADSSFRGIALKDPTKVYSSASTNSSVLKNYQKGSILKYTSYNSQWYRATVYVNGQKRTGYINRSDVENSEVNQAPLRGIALKSTTNIYADASNRQVLKKYPAGSILIYRTFSKNWYEATVYVNGKRKTGYIIKSHVENAVEVQESLKGVALKSPTTVYKNASTQSAWKSYSAGTILSYKTFSKNWYEAAVYVNGKKRTGYIHKSHVENAAKTQESAKGIGLKSPTVVYSRASTGSPGLKSYPQGTILNYKTFSPNWYEAVVYIKGKRTAGYIHSSHLESIYGTSQSLDGVALKNPTNVYSSAARSSKVLKTYKKPNLLKFQTFSPNWYTATVYISGKRTTGYIHRKDVSTEKLIATTTAYPASFQTAVDIQMKRSPQVSGRNGGWVDASKAQVEYYINSSNFNRNTNSYYQFLVLSQPAGLNAKEVNQKILFNHGTLTGKAQPFIDAGKKFGINEAYLISHALLETGNGTSELAKGVPVDNTGKVVPKNEAEQTVFNMYGIGATDSCPLTCGAKRAFDEGWFTPEDAIVGGAEFINTYIKRGQDTLYKMRWNPANPGQSQYATDIGWAVKQTANIGKIYDLLDHYVLIYDIPRYANQPSSSGDPNAYLPEKEEIKKYPAKTYGLTNTDNLNFREKASTSSASLGKLKKGTKVELIGEVSGQTINSNKTWYQIKASGKTGYVHSPYIDILNLLEAKTAINVRPEPNTSKDRIGSVSKGASLAAVLDKDDKIIRSKEWYQVYFNGKTAWVSGGKGGTEYINVK
jgi:beta-N-acetylglucosaminidase